MDELALRRIQKQENAEAYNIQIGEVFTEEKANELIDFMVRLENERDYYLQIIKNIAGAVSNVMEDD